MKPKLFLFVILTILFFNNLVAQQKSPTSSLKTTPKNELSIDFFNFMFNKYSISYDRLYNNTASYGLTLSYSPKIITIFDDYNYKENFTITANHKFYFSKKKNQGFYFEGYLQYRYGKTLNIYNNYDLSQNEQKHFGNLNAGINFGYKYVNKNNFFFDVKGGFGRRLTNFQPSNKNYYTNPYNLNFFFGIGKRFN